MLEQGQKVADCTVIRHLVEDNARHEYLVMSSEGEKKLVQFRGSATWSRLQRQTFHDQIKRLSSLDMSSTCLPIRAIEEEGELYCLYSLAPGSPLQQVLSGEFSARTAIELVIKLVGLIEPAHYQHLFHGGLSPRTIYFDQGHPWLADFSLASLVAFDYRTGVEVEYASPEQIRGESPGIAADIYSLGCLLYALLVGRAPFSSADAFTVGMQHLNDSLPPLPPPLAFCTALLESMTVKTANERLTIQQVREQLEGLLSHSDLDQVPPQAEMETPATDREVEASEDAITMVARIEDQLRELESEVAGRDTESKGRQQEEELPVASMATQTTKGVLSGSRSFYLVLGIIVGFCLGALAFDFFLARPEPVVAPQIYQMTMVGPDFDTVARLWLEGDMIATQKELERLLANFPDHPEVYNNLAAVAAARGEIEQARNWLEQAIELDEQTAAIYRNLGEVYAEMARDSYGRALQLDHQSSVLQLDLFVNQGVVSWPTGTDTILARMDSDDVPVIEVQGPIDTTTIDETEPEHIATDDSEETAAAQEQVDADYPVVAETEQLVVADIPMMATEAPEPVAGAPEPATEPEQVATHEDPVLFLERWARAWSDQDVERYLSFYSEDFIPAGGLNYDEWQAQRRERLQRPDEISVTLADFNVRAETDSLLQLEVVQDYDSENYADRTRKLFDLRRTSDSWKIERERSLELILR